MRERGEKGRGRRRYVGEEERKVFYLHFSGCSDANGNRSFMTIQMAKLKLLLE